MTPASLDPAELPHCPSERCAEVDVWVDAGREGRCFTYVDSRRLGVDLGDLVVVRLRGRRMHGLVMDRRISSPVDRGQDSGSKAPPRHLEAIEALVQSAAVDPLWFGWIEAMAVHCHISSFRMLKAALPPGWLGQRQSHQAEPRRLWWIQLESSAINPQNLPQRQADLQAALAAGGGGAWQRDLQAAGFGSGLVNGLIKRGLIRREKRQPTDASNGLSCSDACDQDLEVPQSLTVEQQEVVEAFQSQPLGTGMLLWGVTGSGKTEVYLQLAARELQAGRHCLILTPEIGLIPQLVDRFRRRFGTKVLEYHSGCSDRERVSTWRQGLTAAKPLVVVGTRSAVFLPLAPLGLIVLDEEHDSSYKQESPMPCYHARDMAMDRARRTGARVVLGSATPSLVSWKNLAPQGQLALARLTRRISDQPLPPVHVVDMRQELADGHRRLISRPLMERLSALPEAGEQAVVLVPRRGYSSFLSCRSCGEVVQCPNCDVALTVHRSRQGHQWLRCHWCDHRAEVESSCHKCGSKAFKPFGAGTQRVMEHLVEELQGLRLLRFDRDSTAGRDGHRRLLEQFAAGEADVLVGTQMLAKGMDLPRVTLAAVLAADGLLHRPDLQAGEQSLQLLMQLAGRAGRGERPGHVLVQTYCPDHPVIHHLVDGRYGEFLKEEACLRHEAGLVPYSRACLLRLSGDSAAVTATAAAVLAEQIKPLCDAQGWCLVGPAPAPIARVAGRSRWQLLLHGPEESPLPLPSGSTLWNGLPRGVSLAVDPDPIQL